ncbi:MAG: EscU/YscU/HrcU family type III secretion system export apparatus switch protein [Pirellulaceae bacterium]|nr:EscU/YscU/HrcU family type III secretion system export apparatus switch protein [Pirellulaceae bacterium]
MSEDRSQAATPRRRRLAREQGHLPRSQELASAVIFLGAVAAIVVSAPRMFEILSQLMRRQLSAPGMRHDQLADQATELQQVGIESLIGLLPVLGLICGAAVMVHLTQTGFLWLPQKMMPDFNRLNPFARAQHLVSCSQVARIGLLIVRIVVMLVAGAALIRHLLPNLLQLSLQPTDRLLNAGAGLLIQFSTSVGAVLLLFGVIDYLLQKLKFERDLQMSPEELREEIRAVQNDVSLSRKRSLTQQALNASRVAQASEPEMKD